MNNMNLQALQVAAPAAFSDSAAPHVSDRYTHVKTSDIVERLMDRGFSIRSAAQQKTQKRKSGHELFQRHKVTMDLPDAKGFGATAKLGNIFPTLTLVNSGDWSTNFLLAAGLFRLVCENGMIAPFGAANETLKVRHDRIDEDVTLGIDRVIEKAPQLFQFADDAISHKMTEQEQYRFARKAARLRFDVADEDPVSSEMIAGLNQARRPDDAGDDLWSIFNRVQENGTHGGFRVAGSNGRMRRVRSRSNIASDLSWNQGLWNLTKEVLQGPEPSLN